MWCRAVKFGGDSGAVQQVSDIGGGFGRVPFTARSRGCHEIDVKREIISAPLRPDEGGPAQAVSRATRAVEAGLRAMRRLTRIFAGIFARERHRDPSSHGERAPTPAVLIRGACAARHFKTRSTCRISLKATAEWSMPLPADWPSPLTV